MYQTDVLIIGGGPAGMISASAAKSNNPDKRFLLIRKEKQVLIPSGIPYIFGTLDSSNNNIANHDASMQEEGIEIKIAEVVALNTHDKVCETSDGMKIRFEKLILATGSTPAIPNQFINVNLQNIFTIPKDKVYLDNMQADLAECKKIVVIGGGTTGIEMADELSKKSKEVTVIEQASSLLGSACDVKISDKVESVLTSHNIKVKTGVEVAEVLGKVKVTEVLLKNGEKLVSHAVIFASGYAPNTNLARQAGLPVNRFGAVQVDEFMRTEHPDIFAIGDCAEKKDFITGKPANIMLASTACTEARIAGINLFRLTNEKTFKGTVPIITSQIGDTSFGMAGLSEKTAQKEGLDVVSAVYQGIDKHPGSLPSAHKQIVKLTASRQTGILLGGEVIGGPSTGELLNVIGLAIQNQMTIYSLYTMHIGTRPLLTGSPGGYSIIKAAEILLKIIKTTC